ncbi:hypothetical protein NK6_6358 [Bradyrhizobium diazoefficiens]|uniref:Uncharacterized protein n=1 Tax=Bradyrhizobium diazoefficiens TaxID=1355477 RepID=A0A0E4BT33_9BRAD|nr:hypothetical protein NK6_6358 [Bradyrhizobium diazoefficiens]
MTFLAVIPGRCAASNSESDATISRFRVRATRAPE